MKKNMGTIDRVLRIGSAVVIGSLYLTGQVSGTVGILLGLVAVIFAVTGFAGMCPIYSVLKLSTCQTGAGAGKGAQ